MSGPADGFATQEVGFTGGNLPIWRAREAMRLAEISLTGHAQVSQSLESRAISMLGWSVAGALAVGAAAVGGNQLRAAYGVAICLAITATLCAYSILARKFRGAPGYPPATLLQDMSGSEYEALVSLANGYQDALDNSAAEIRHVRRLLTLAMITLLGAPLLGWVLLTHVPPGFECNPLRLLGISFSG